MSIDSTVSLASRPSPSPPEIADGERPGIGEPHRRGFLRALASGAAVVAGASLPGVARPARAGETPAAARTGEELVRELAASLSAEQKAKLVLPWDHGAANGQTPSRLRMMNSAFGGLRIREQYTPAQQELNEKILRALCNGEEGFERISRRGKYDEGGGFGACGAVLFGDPGDGGRYSWVFTGHHLTVRCDGDSEEGAAFGGPMYYGHSPNGHTEANVFFYQTKAVESVYEALTEEQRKLAAAPGSPGEQAGSVTFRAVGEARPGVRYADLASDAQKLVENVMQAILSPYRAADAEEALRVVKANGGFEQMSLAFYEEQQAKAEGRRWRFWRLEGPGFVWNFRVLPHVHTYVRISSKLA